MKAFVLIEGRIAITLDTGERFEMKAGDAVSVPAGHTGVCVKCWSSAASLRW
ncbi:MULTISPECIES: cupin domain-containing protein [unclassified Pseudomonas]|uniref:cupin domain-containing protein n=1 Tax=unclassified Pseudomonas TaxID=196821 RepID=UPI0011A74223